MTLTWGRFGSGGTAAEPESWKDTGPNTVALAGRLFMGNATSARVARQQLLGYLNNPDEPWVAISSTADPDRTGFYRPTSITCDTVPETLPGGMLPFTASLQLIQGGAYPLIEMLVRGLDRVGTPGGVTTTPWHAVPDTWSGYDNNGATNASKNRSLGGGVNMRLFRNANYYLRSAGTPEAAAGVAVPDFYTGASTLTFNGNVIIGRSVPQAGTISSFSLDNGLVRAQMGGATLLALSAYSGATWCTQDVVLIGAGGATFNGPARSWTVLRNSPEYSAFRLAVPYAPAANASSVLLVDVALRRGSRHLELLLRSNHGDNYGIAMPAVTAMDHVDANLGANRAHSNDATRNNNRIVFGSGVAYTEDLANGKLYATSVNTTVMDLLLGYEVAGSGAADPDRATDLRDQYFAQMGETQLVRAQ